MTRFLLALLAASTALGHYTLKHPTAIGPDIEQEDNAPCGGYTPDLSTGSAQLQDFHVDGEFIEVESNHPQANWLFRATLDPTAKTGWDLAYPIFQQSGLGTFCVPEVTIPADWTGKRGVVGVAENGPDGILWSCIAANFVTGKSAPESGACANSSTVALSFTNDASLTGQLNSSSQTNSSGGDSGGDNHDGAASGLIAPLTAVLGLAAGLVALAM